MLTSEEIRELIEEIYTTSIMTNLNSCGILSIIKREKSGSEKIPERKNMTTIFRFEHLDSERYLSKAPQSYKEWCLCFMRPFEMKLKRKCCIDKCS